MQPPVLVAETADALAATTADAVAATVFGGAAVNLVVLALLQSPTFAGAGVVVGFLSLVHLLLAQSNPNIVSRWRHIDSMSWLPQTRSDEFLNEGHYVTSIVHSDEWVLWGEKVVGKSKWTIQSSQSDLWNYISETWAGDATTQHCVSSIIHGCA
jgi:hypothetical protein